MRVPTNALWEKKRITFPQKKSTRWLAAARQARLGSARAIARRRDQQLPYAPETSPFGRVRLLPRLGTRKHSNAPGFSRSSSSSSRIW